jgi:hypothetical protein
VNSDFNLVFKGEVALDHDIAATREKLAKVFKASDEKIAALFSGKPMVVKKGLSSEDGIKLQRQMLQLGAITYLESAVVNVRTPPNSSTPAATRRSPAHEKATGIPLTLKPIEEPVSVADSDEQDAADNLSATKFSFPQFNFSLRVAFTLLLIIVGVACLAVFSPYPDYVVRKGFAIGGALLFIGLRRLKH